MPERRAPFVPKVGEIFSKPEEMLDTLGYDAAKQRLLVGHGFIDNVPAAVWQYEVSGKQVLVQWSATVRKIAPDPSWATAGDRPRSATFNPTIGFPNTQPSF